MGALVTSFDFDEDSVMCPQTLRDRYGDADRRKTLRRSALDIHFMAGLGTFNSVYSWVFCTIQRQWGWELKIP